MISVIMLQYMVKVCFCMLYTQFILTAVAKHVLSRTKKDLFLS